jgi:hypothetical protein
MPHLSQLRSRSGLRWCDRIATHAKYRTIGDITTNAFADCTTPVKIKNEAYQASVICRAMASADDPLSSNNSAACFQV